MGAGAEHGPQKRQWQRSALGKPLHPSSGSAGQPGLGAVGVAGCPMDALTPTRSAPHSCLYWVVLPSPPPLGPPYRTGQGTCPGRYGWHPDSAMGQQTPPPHPPAPASWVRCLASLSVRMSPQDWHGHFLLPLSPSCVSSSLPCPASPICSYTAPGCLHRRGHCWGALPVPGGPGAVRPLPSLLGLLLQPCLSASCMSFVPVAGQSPMTLSICRLTAGSWEPALHPCTILHVAPSSPGTTPQLLSM